MNVGDCVRDQHGNCQHLVYDSENERWIIPSGTHIFTGHTVFADSFTDYLVTDQPEGATPKDDPVNELRHEINDGLHEMNIHQAYDFGPLLQRLVIFVSARDHKIFDHAFRLGRKHRL